MNISGLDSPTGFSVAWKVGLALLLFIVFVFLGLGAMMSLRDESWDLGQIEAYLKAPIPKDAQNLRYTSGTNTNVHVELSFQASPSSALGFTSHFCDGVLHSGYDPFNAINVDKQVPDSFKIDWVDYYTSSYYSYSPHTSQLKAGVFCSIPNSLFWVLVDQSDPALYSIRFKHALSRNLHFADVKPIADFPIMIRGVMTELNGSYSAWGPFCLDLDPDVVGGPDKKWSSLLGTDVQILIDDKAMTAAYVSSDGRLVRKDGKHNYSDPDSNLFQYCLLMWQSGLHTLTVQVPSGIASKSTYSWTMRGESSASCENNHPDNDCYGN